MSLVFLAALLLGPQASTTWPSAEPPDAWPLATPLVFSTRPVYSFFPDTASTSRTSSFRQIDWQGAPIGIPPGTRQLDAWWIRAAYGMRVWGKRLRQQAWVEKADQMMNLVTASSLLMQKGPSEGPAGLTIIRGDRGFGVVFACIYAGEQRDYSGREKLLAQLSAWVKETLERGTPLSPSEVSGLISFRIWFPQDPSASLITDQVISGGLAGFASSKDKRPEQLLDEAGAWRLAGLTSAMPGAGAKAAELVQLALAKQITSRDLDSAPFSSFGFIDDPSPRPAYEAWHAFTVMDIAADQPDGSLFRRGVAMLRGCMALLHTPANTGQGFEYGRLPLGRMGGPPWDLAKNQEDSAPGFTLGEGQLMTTLYFASQRFGSVYTSRHGWMAALDGIRLDTVRPDGSGAAINLLRLNRSPYQGPFEIEHVLPGRRIKLGPPESPLAIRDISLRQDAAGLRVVAKPAFQQTGERRLHPVGRFIFGDGSVAVAKLGDEGFEAPVDRRLLRAPVRFAGVAGSQPMAAGPVQLRAWLPAADEWKGWLGSAGEAPTGGIIRTTDQGRGAFMSPRFLITSRYLAFETLRLDPGCSVDLTDAESGQVFESLAAPWPSRSPARRTKWDLAKLQGRMAVMRLNDRTKAGQTAIRLVTPGPQP